MSVRTASWIAVSRATGTPVLETFLPNVAAAINRDRYEVLSALEWLVRLNTQLKLVRWIHSHEAHAHVTPDGRICIGSSAVDPHEAYLDRECERIMKMSIEDIAAEEGKTVEQVLEEGRQIRLRILKQIRNRGFAR